MIEANSNREPARTLHNGIMTLHLEIREGTWFPGADTGPSLKMDAFAEEDRPAQIPAPLIRVPEGTEIHLTIRNLLAATAVLHGLHRHPGDPNDVVRIAGGESRNVSFSAGVAGTYAYWASAGGDTSHTAHGRPYREDSQLGGAFIVDSLEGAVPDRVFVLGLWRSQAVELVAKQIAVINGKAWPYTERLTYNAGETVHWRLVNASDAPHPMHLHGSYYRVDSEGDGESDRIVPPEQRETVVTRMLLWGATMSMSWTPPTGRWLFHCHLLLHTRAGLEGPADGDHQEYDGPPHSHAQGLNHMGGMALGITVNGKYAEARALGRTKKLRLLVRERLATNAVPAGFSYQIENGHKRTPAILGPSGPPLVLERDRAIEIEVVNQLREPTTVHWHGIELPSYFDGVAGWDWDGIHIAPQIEPGRSFRVQFTPPRAGTFIYHTHLNDEVQMLLGLCGPLIVLEPGTTFDPAIDVVFLVSRGGQDLLKAPFLLNGNAEPPSLHWRVGQKYRLRLINITASNGASFSLLASSGLLRWRALAKDGADLPPNQSVFKDAKQGIIAGETYDFEYQPDRPGLLRMAIESARLKMSVAQNIEVQ